MEYLGAGGPVVNYPNVNKGINTFAMNVNLSLYMENIKNRPLYTLQSFYNFSKEHYKHNN